VSVQLPTMQELMEAGFPHGKAPPGVPKGDPAIEWQRSRPDIVVYYLPEGEGGGLTGDNEHFLVTETPGGELLAVWTQSGCEGSGTNHLVFAHSRDHLRWTPPQYLGGYWPGRSEKQASWGFPLVSAQGRIYVFYTKEIEVWDNARHCSGPIGTFYSDDNGHTWTAGADIPFPKNRFDHPDPAVPPNWIVWQKPIRDSKGRWLAPYTQSTSGAVFTERIQGWCNWDSRAAYMRFENIDEGPDPQDIRITWLPLNSLGIEVPHRDYPHFSVCQEPSVVLLPDGRLFCVTRTMTGYIWYSVSEDDGETWRPPEVLRYRDGGEPVPHPMSPGPVYRLADGRYLLVYHNNPGVKGQFSQFKKKWSCNEANFLRDPTFIAVGEFRPNAHQPIWFSPPKQLLATDGIPVGPKATAEIGTYTSLTEWQGRRVLWYPDRKFFLLGKDIPDELLADMRVD
jgi:hypothetical protein